MFTLRTGAHPAVEGLTEWQAFLETKDEEQGPTYAVGIRKLVTKAMPADILKGAQGEA